jgi:serine protease Do
MEPYKRLAFFIFLVALFYGFYSFWLEPRLEKRGLGPGRSLEEKKKLLSQDRAGRLFQDIVALVDPSVVSIRTERVESVQPLFGRPFQFKAQSGGSGIVFSREGHIVTNGHIVGDAQKITVTLSGGEELEAKILGIDSLTDIALIKVNAALKSPAAFGDSDSLETGQWVLAVGNPLGLSHSVSFGIVSALRRQTPAASEMFEDYVQTDAAVNPGNSGGPLINLDGEVIGMNTLLLSPSQENAGVGFAIPSNIVRWVASSLIAHGRILRGWLGVELQAVDQNIAAAMELPGQSGALISRVLPASPAEKAGLKPGDVVLKMGGIKIETIHDLRNRVAQAKPGEPVHLEILREKKKLTLKAVLGEKPGKVTAPGIPNPPPGNPESIP